VQELLAGGVAVDEPDQWGNTALLLACFSETHHPELVALLRRHGADPLRRNIHWQTPRGQAHARYLLSGFDPLADLPPPDLPETEIGELSETELAAVAGAVRTVVAGDLAAVEAMSVWPPGGDPYALTRDYGRWGTVDLIVPPGDPRSWTGFVIRHDDLVSVDVAMWTRQEGRSDLMLQLELRTDARGAPRVAFRGLLVP
jgi:hypothetical protein